MKSVLNQWPAITSRFFFWGKRRYNTQLSSHKKKKLESDIQERDNQLEQLKNAVSWIGGYKKCR